MKQALLKNFFCSIAAFLLVVLYLPRLSADQNPFGSSDVMDMVSGDIQTIAVKGLTRVSVTNPDVADISDADINKVSILAKKEGYTLLFLWDKAGKRTVKIRVASEDLISLRARMERILEEANITGVKLEENLDEGKVVATGILSKDDKARMDQVMGPFTDNLLDLVKEERNNDLIEVDMQVIEISTTYEQSLGIEWGGNGGIALNYTEQGVPFGDKFKDLFKIGNFARQTPLQATVNALLSEGKAKLISKPRLVVVSGKQASFLVGGEIPINATTTNSTGSSQTTSTTYSQYGVNMTVTPTIQQGKISVILNMDIRDVDNSTDGLSSGGNVAFITRTASTNLLLDNKQTIVLAGLIKYEASVNYTEVPFLSKIPLLGAMFRSKNIPGDTNTEMVIILTPTVMTNKKIEDKEIVMPTPSERDAYNQFDAKYEHEPLPTWPEPKVTLPEPIPSPEATPVARNTGDAEAMAVYARTVQWRISNAISYPQGSGLSGTVKLKLHILQSGTLDSGYVIESSGSSVLDQDALQAAKAAAPYGAFTPGMDQDDLILTIPIVYNKRSARNPTPAEKVIDSY